MKRFISILSGLLLAAVISLAQGKWEQSGVSQYGTGGINLSGERIDNSYNAGKFNSEVKSTSKNNPYVYFRKGQFSVPAKTYNPGATVSVSMNISVKRHSGNGTPKGSAGAVLVNGKAGQGTSVPTQVNVSGKDAAKNGNATLTVPTHSAAGNNFSIVYSCFDIKVVYLYRWVEDKPVEKQPAPAADPVAPAQEEPAVEERPTQSEEIVMPDDTILPPEDEPEPVAEEDTEGVEEESTEGIDEDALTEAVQALKDDDLTGEAVKKALKKADTDTVLSLLGLDLTKKDLITYGIIAGLGLLVLILLLVLIFRKSPEKKAAKQEAKKAAAEAKAAAKAEAAEKAAAAKAERDAKLAEQKAKQEEQKAAAAEKAAAAKAERDAKLAEQKAAAAEKAAAAKAAQEAKAAELKQKQEAAKAEREAKLAELKAKKEAAAAAKAAAPKPEPKPAAKPAPKPAEEPKPAGKRFCENCGAPLAPDAAFCENCGTKVS